MRVDLGHAGPFGAGLISATQKRIIQSIVSVLETGKLPSDGAYSTVSILSDGAGISYGLHQATAKGPLTAVIDEYIRAGGIYASRMRPYIGLIPQTVGMGYTSPIPLDVLHLMEILRLAGADPKMQVAQRAVFDRFYWVPSSVYASSIGLQCAFSHLALYDTWIHSGGSRVDRLRSKFAAMPPTKGGDETVWTVELLKARRAFLATFEDPNKSRENTVRRTVGRVDALLRIAASGNWDLEPPLTVYGVRVA